MASKVNYFLKDLHKAWMELEPFRMQVFMEYAEDVMSKSGVTFKDRSEIEDEDSKFLLEEGPKSTSICFALAVNDESKDHFENFERVCLAYMDFSKIN